MDYQIKCGTIQDLIECWAPHNDTDSDFATEFMLTYRNLMSSSELVLHLAKRFSMKLPKLRPDEMDIWIENQLTPVRVHIFNVLRHWIEVYSVRLHDAEVFADVRAFVRDKVRPHLPSVGAEAVGQASV